VTAKYTPYDALRHAFLELGGTPEEARRAAQAAKRAFAGRRTYWSRDASPRQEIPAGECTPARTERA
jgi:hypothetical protein